MYPPELTEPMRAELTGIGVTELRSATEVDEVLAALPEASVDCIVTSPPYYGLRDYGVDGQIAEVALWDGSAPATADASLLGDSAGATRPPDLSTSATLLTYAELTSTAGYALDPSGTLSDIGTGATSLVAAATARRTATSTPALRHPVGSRSPRPGVLHEARLAMIEFRWVPAMITANHAPARQRVQRRAVRLQCFFPRASPGPE